MMKRLRIFMNPIEGQEKWLNDKASEGLKLLKAGSIFYDFEKCNPGQYQYAVDYVGNMSAKQRLEYEKFLDDMDINYYQKPMNIGQFSLGRAKYRPYANGGGKLATSKGMINKEILILEKENSASTFNIYSNVKDKIAALKERMEPHYYLLTFIVLVELYIILVGKPLIDISYFSTRNSDFLNNTTTAILIGCVAIIPIIRLIQLSLSVKTLKEKEKIRE